MRTLAAMVLCGWIGASAWAAEDADPAARLDAMSRGFRSLDYAGVFTYEQGQTLSSVRIFHRVIDGEEHERVVHLDGEQREFLRRGHRVDCEHAGDRLVRRGPIERFAERASAAADGAGARLADHYAMEFDGTERVANHHGPRIRIVPRDPYRYGMTVVLEDESSLLLKSETTDGAGRVLERFQFVDLRIGGPVTAADLAAESAGAREAGGHEPSQPPEPFAWAVAWLPPGFVPTGRDRRAGPAADRPVEAQTFTDGLAVFAVYVESAVEALSRPGQAMLGATVSYVLPRGTDHLVTVVGEIPPETAELIANAVSFPEAAP